MNGAHDKSDDRDPLVSLPGQELLGQAWFVGAPDPVLVLDQQGYILALNPAARRVLGWGTDQEWVQERLGIEWHSGQPQWGELSLGTTGRILEYALAPVADRLLLIGRDVTERKAMEQQLRVSQLQYETVFKILPAGVSITDDQGHLIQVNLASEAILGIPADEHNRRTYDEPKWQMLRPDGSSMPPAEYPAVIALQEGRTVVAQEQGIVWPDGHTKWIETSATPIPLQGYGVAITYIDITERKIAQQKLHDQALREQALSAVIQAIRGSLDLEQIFETAVLHIAHFLGSKVSIVKYLPDQNCWRPLAKSYQAQDIHSDKTDVELMEDIPDQNNPFSEQLKRGQVIQITNSSLIQDPVNQEIAKIFPGAWLLVPIHVNGKTWGSLTQYQLSPAAHWQPEDVTLAERIAQQLAMAIQQAEIHHQLQILNASLEQQVRQRTQDLEKALQFEAALKRVIDRVRISLDESQILDSAVEELGRILGLQCCDAGIYSEDGTVSTIYHEYTHLFDSAKGFRFAITDSFHADLYPLLFSGAITQFCDLVDFSYRKNQQGKTRLACALRDEHTIYGDLWMLKFTSEAFSPQELDLIEQVATQCTVAIRQARLYQESQSQVVKLQELNQLKEDFIHTISHELRTPLASMKVALKMLEIYQYQPERQGRYLNILKAEWDRELTLVNELLELQSLESGIRSPEELSWIVIQEWLPPLMEPFYLRCRERSQIFEVHWDPVAVMTDPNLLQRVILELLNNACKYTPPEHRIRLNIQAIEGGIQIQVINTGVTISPDQLARIFDKFHRISGQDHFNQGGTGLGLALAQKVMQVLQGSISVCSQDNITTFTLIVPSLPQLES